MSDELIKPLAEAFDCSTADMALLVGVGVTLIVILVAAAVGRLAFLFGVWGRQHPLINRSQLLQPRHRDKSSEKAMPRGERWQVAGL
jgi:hypothetical protein